MTHLSPVTPALASVLPIHAAAPATVPDTTTPDTALTILAVAEALQPDLAQGFQIDALRLRVEMERAFGGSDADGAWDWITSSSPVCRDGMWRATPSTRPSPW